MCPACHLWFRAVLGILGIGFMAVLAAQPPGPEIPGKKPVKGTEPPPPPATILGRARRPSTSARRCRPAGAANPELLLARARFRR